MKNLEGTVSVIVFGIVLGGCATSSSVVLPSGERGYTISCDGSMVNMNVCYQKAGDLCPNGYEILNQTQNSGWVATQGFAGSTNLKGIVVKCSDGNNGKKRDYIPEEAVEINEGNLSEYQNRVDAAYLVLSDEAASQEQREAAKRTIIQIEPKINIYKRTLKDNYSPVGGSN